MSEGTAPPIKSRAKVLAIESGQVLARVAAWVTAAVGIFLFGRQVVWYLKQGTWVSLPATDIFLGPRTVGASSLLGNEGVVGPLPTSGFAGWLALPESWIGLQKVVYGLLHFLSIPFAFLLLAILLYLLSGSVVLSLNSEMSFRRFYKKPKN